MTDSSGLTRRHFLTAATAVTAGAGAAATAVPFVSSFKPSARAQALGAPVQRDVSRLEPGAMVRVEWRGRVIFIVRRTEAMLSKLNEPNQELKDPNSEVVEQQPEYAVNEFRSIKPEYLVVEGVCTHFGCAPVARFELASADLGADWPGGFFCPCHGSMFDLAGRVFGGPAPTNLRVPPHRFVNETTILVGVDTGNA